MAVAPSTGTAQWQNGLFTCDFGKCIFAYLFPNWFYGRTRNKFDGSNVFFNCCFATPCLVRNLVREGYGIEGSCAMDLILPCVLPWCSMVQTDLEVDAQIAKGYAAPAAGSYTEPWSDSLFGCFSDIFGFFYSWFFPCGAAATARSRFDGSNWFFNACVVMPVMHYNIVREGYKIDGNCITDILLAHCLQPCAIARLLRETKTKGPKSAAGKPAAQQM